MLRARAVSSAITTRGAEAGETMRTSGCRSPSPTNYAHKNKQRREPRQDSTNWQVQVQTHSLSTRQRTECVAHTRTRTSGRKVQNPSARRHSLSAWAENDGVSRVLHGSLWRKPQLCRLPKQQRGTPHEQDKETEGNIIRQLRRIQFRYITLRHTNTNNTSEHNDNDTTRRRRSRLLEKYKGRLNKKRLEEKNSNQKIRPRRHRQTEMASSINAIDRMMATRGSKANEEAEEKKRARASPHKAPPPDPKKGRSSPIGDSLGENHHEEAIEAQPMSVDEPQFSDDPDEGPEEAEATIASSLEGIDIATNKGTTAEETKAQPNRTKKNNRNCHSRTNQRRKRSSSKMRTSMKYGSYPSTRRRGTRSTERRSPTLSRPNSRRCTTSTRIRRKS